MDTLQPYGRGQLMVICAVRYCLGRRTYIVSDCAEWLVPLWPSLEANTRAVIQRDVEEAFHRAQSWQGSLGDPCDVEQWMQVRALWTAA